MSSIHLISFSLDTSFIVNMGQFLSRELEIGLTAITCTIGGIIVGLCIKQVCDCLKRSNPPPREVGEQVNLGDGQDSAAARPLLPAPVMLSDRGCQTDLGPAAEPLQLQADPADHLYEAVDHAPLYENAMVEFGVKFDQLTEAIQLPPSLRRFDLPGEEEREDIGGAAGGLE